jgi:hypothetical protein
MGQPLSECYVASVQVWKVLNDGGNTYDLIGEKKEQTMKCIHA